jgi:hypothetical protein
MRRAIDSLLPDLRCCVRVRVRNLASTAIIVLTLAVGLACNVVAFSLVRESRAGDPTLFSRLTAADLNDLRRETALFEDLARYQFQPLNLTGPTEPERVRAARQAGIGTRDGLRT